MPEFVDHSVVPPSLHELTARIRFIATDETSRIVWTDHAQLRMEERDISLRTVLTVLQSGECRGEVRPGRAGNGEWKTKIVAEVKGQREIGVAAAIGDGGRLVIVSVMWENE